jgi:uncharacterized repeat protein (TIGR03803 family)
VNDFYRVSLSGDLTVLANFPSTFEGRQAEGPLLKVGNGQFLGTTNSGGTTGRNEFGTIHRLTEQGTVTPVIAFPKILGRSFNSELTETPAGLLYGTVADNGRRSPAGVTRIPAPFKMSKAGSATPLRPFVTQSSISPATRFSRLADVGGGVLFGAISEGGMPTFPNTRASGFIYRITPNESVSTVYQFSGNGAPGDAPNEHGETPDGALTPGPDSQLYGTTAFGGSQARGTLFKIDGNGALTTLASFNNSTGVGPRGDLIFDDGLFYGRTSFGGANNSGTFFSATPAGEITVLASFPQNMFANSRLILARDGNFYGTTVLGGANHMGTVFRLTKSGILTTLASMDATTGRAPLGVIEAIDGNFYGVTQGSFEGPGAIFQVTPGGVITSLFHFDTARGTGPVANLMQASDGHLYGTTAANGPARGGVVYRVTLPPKQLLNIATRMRVLTGENVLIGGFIITGNDPKKIIIRGIGPSLGGLGIAGALTDPTLELHQGNAMLAANDNWKTRPDGSSQQAEVEETAIPPVNDFESAIVATLNPGTYTAILAGKNQGTGIGVVEVYDLAAGADSKLANISSRGFVDTGDNIMIGGLIVGAGPGGGSANVFVRTLGPSLTGLGVAGALQNPTLEFRNSSGTLLAANDDWKLASDGNSQQAKIEATSIPPTNDLESALLLAVPPGSYTAIVRGKNNTTGVAVVEVYNLQ